MPGSSAWKLCASALRSSRAICAANTAIPCAEAIEEHLESCDSCEKTASRLELELRQALRPILKQRLPQPTSSDSPSPPKPSRAAIDLTGVEEIGDFRLLGEPDRGGFAVVYRALQKSPQRTVALKISQHRTQEASVLARLEHPHIVRVHEEREWRGWHLLCMQYVPGGSLRQVIRFMRKIEPCATHRAHPHRGHRRSSSEPRNQPRQARAPRLFRRGRLAANRLPDWRQIGHALHFAHVRGVQHRDIKPANVLLSTEGSPLLADFNLSFGSQVEGESPDDHFGGSIPYMSPEQLEVLIGRRAAKELGPASDVYSLGIVLEELATGQRPHDLDAFSKSGADTRQELIARRRTGLTRTEIPAALPQGLRLVLDDCLEPDPNRRCNDASHMARRLQLCTRRDLHDLLHPGQSSWLGRCAQWPLPALVVLGLIPNVLVALVNGVYLYYYSYEGRDASRESFFGHYLGVIFGFFLLAIAILCLYVWPVVKGVQMVDRASGLWDDQRQLCARPLSVAWIDILAGDPAHWVASGFVYYFLTRQALGQLVASQLMHGLIASSVTFLLITLVATESFFPRLLRDEEDPDARRRLTRLDWEVDLHSAILALTPSLALMSLAWFAVQHADFPLLFSLGASAVGYLCAFVFGPRIRVTIGRLKMTVAPTRQLLYGESAHHDPS